MSSRPRVDAGSTETERFWDDLYRGRAARWSGRANPVLVDVVASLAPATALDLGCGEGGDAVWLAERGWQVTAVDVSATALRRAAGAAAQAGVDDRIELERRDLAHSFPTGPFDLVSAQYLQSPVAFPREQVLRAAAGAVAPGGLLLVVEHGSVAPWSWHRDAVIPPPEELLEALDLDPERWEVERVGAPERRATGPNGLTATVADNVVAARRRRA